MGSESESERWLAARLGGTREPKEASLSSCLMPNAPAFDPESRLKFTTDVGKVDGQVAQQLGTMAAALSIAEAPYYP